jgi:hypothetical protein
MWIIAAFLIGKWFFDLARKNGKIPAPFAIAGILTYTIAEWIIGSIIRFFLVEFYDEWWLGWVSVPISFFAVWVVYAYLKSSWQPKKRRERKEYDARVAKSSYISPGSDSGASKVNLEKPGHSEPPRNISSRSTGRYNKNER